MTGAWANFPGGGVYLGHVRPLSLGGEDIDSNVQVLCHGCHGLKTRIDFRFDSVGNLEVARSISEGSPGLRAGDLALVQEGLEGGRRSVAGR